MTSHLLNNSLCNQNSLQSRKPSFLSSANSFLVLKPEPEVVSPG